MKNVVILISGRGSNLIAIADALRSERWPARISAVICNRPDAPGLAAARERGIFTDVLDSRDYADRTAYDAELARRVDAHSPSLVLLAGFMRILGKAFVDHYAGRLLNIHPSLLPAFPGLRTHRRALQAGVKLHGATVHLVTGELDAGPILVQAAVPVLASDDEQTLAARVLAAEHRIYPLAVRWMLEDRLRIDGGSVWLRDPADGAQALAWLDATPADASVARA